MLNTLKELRTVRYAKLLEVLKTKGRLPFHKGYQKYTKLMMFIYESLLDMATNTGYQNNDGLLYKIRFTSNCVNPNLKQKEYHGKILFEYGMGPRSSHFKSFEIQHVTKEELVILFTTFAEYYGLILVKKEAKYIRSATDYEYTINLPPEA